MGPVIVNLHGAEHTDRRRLENRLFSPETIGFFEHERLPAIIDCAVASLQTDGGGDLLPLARHIMMRLSIEVAGVDLPHDRDEDDAFDDLFGLMHRMSRAAVVVHATGDKQAIIDDGDAALAEFADRFYAASLDRRMTLIANDAPAPRDVLTTLLVNEDRLDLPPGHVLREVAYFPWVGSHSTAAQFVHAMHHVFEWLAERPAERGRLVVDDEWRLRFVHESLRLHPASPVACRRAVRDTRIANRQIDAGTDVTIAIESANRDRAVFGDEPERFDPDRAVAAGIARWGLSFGSGMHACLGRELAGGRSVEDGPALQGAVSMLIAALLRAGARPDPGTQPSLDPSTTRNTWGRYPVIAGS